MNLKIPFRNFNRYRLTSSITVLSLAVGLACVYLISIFLLREYNPDSFQEHGERIYALEAESPFGNTAKMHVVREGGAEYIKQNFTGVEDFCRYKNSGSPRVSVRTNDFDETYKVISASPNFFDFFTYRLIAKASDGILEASDQVVISERLAEKYFGNENPIGKRITLTNNSGNEQLYVSGVFEKPSKTTVLNFDMVKKIGARDSFAFVMLSDEGNASRLEAQFSEQKNTIPIIHNGNPGAYSLQKLRKVYYDTSLTAAIHNVRDRKDLHIALIIGLMIISVAIFNYLMLVRNLLDQKTKEMSIRRINGCSDLRLVFGFMGTLVLPVFLAVVLGLFIVLWMLPFYNDLVNTGIEMRHLMDGSSLFFILGIPLLLLGGSALFVWKNVAKSRSFIGMGNFMAPKPKIHMPAFNVLQLAITFLLMVGAIVILKQMRYISDKDIGLNKQVAEVRIPMAQKDKAWVFKTELEKLPMVDKVAVAMASPVLEHYLLQLTYEEQGEEREYTASAFMGDRQYLDVLGIDVVAGNGFYPTPSANKNSCVINKSLAGLFPDRDLIGKPLPGNEELTVVGIVNDFHYDNLKNRVAPGYVFYGDSGNYLMVKPITGQEKEVKMAIQSLWKKLIPDYPLNVETIGERFEWMHRDNTNYIKLIGACSAISIFLSMMGLFAAAFLSGRRRTKEIGIRKVNGAKISEIITLLNKDLVKWAVIAFLFTMPLAWYIMKRWLENFAYRTELNGWLFILVGAIIVLIALLTVSWQCWRAAVANPVDALRDE